MAMLRQAWNAAPNVANTLLAQLESGEQNTLNLFSTAGSLASVGKNSASQSFFRPGLGEYSVAQIQSFWTMLIQIYYRKLKETQCLQNNAVAWFTEKYPSYNQDSDQAVYDFTMHFLAEPDWTGFEVDVSELRIPPTQVPTPVLTV